MTKFLIPAAALITLLVVTDAAFAAGASSFAPGREMHDQPELPAGYSSAPAAIPFLDIPVRPAMRRAIDSITADT